MTPDVAVEAGSGAVGNVHHVDFRKDEEIEPMLGVREVAEILGAGLTWVHREARKGNLPGKMIAGKYRFWRSDILRWINEQGKKATG